MTIDEAIAHAGEVAKRNREQYKNCPADRIDIEHQTCAECAEEHEQLAEWLEELKRLRDNSNGYIKEDIELNRKAMYNKAIDDYKYLLAERLEAGRCVDEKFAYIDLCDIDEIAEQLKAGGLNE